MFALDRIAALLRPWFFVLAVLATGPALAQTTAPVPTEPAPAQTLETKDLKSLVDTLKDEKARDKLVEQLETLLKAREAVEAKQPVEEAETWLSTLSDRLRDTVGSVFAVGGAVAGLGAG